MTKQQILTFEKLKLEKLFLSIYHILVCFILQGDHQQQGEGDCGS